MNKKKLFLDCLKAFSLGIIAAFGLSFILFLSGLLFGQVSVYEALEMSKNGMFFIVALGLFLLAGMIMVKGKKPEKFWKNNGWKNHFSVIYPKTAMAVAVIGVVVFAIILDYMQIYLF